MIVIIRGDQAVSHDFFEDDREGLENMYGVAIDSGPGGDIEVSGVEEDVLKFLDDHGITDWEDVSDDEFEEFA